MAQGETKTLVLVCRGDFCRILERLLRSEGISRFRQAGLEIGCCPARTLGSLHSRSEAFVIEADDGDARKLVRLLSASPVSGGTEEVFALYTVGRAQEPPDR